MKKTILALALSAVAFTASAAGIAVGAAGALNLESRNYSGIVAGNATSATTGGGQATTGSNATGYAVQSSHNAGTANSYAGGAVISTGVSTYTGGSSTADSVSTGYVSGNGTGNTAGSVGNDYTAKAAGTFQQNTVGTNLIGNFTAIGVGFTF